MKKKITETYTYEPNATQAHTPAVGGLGKYEHDDHAWPSHFRPASMLLPLQALFGSAATADPN